MEMKDKQELYNKIIKYAKKEYMCGLTQQDSYFANEELKEFMEYIFENYKKEDPEQ